MSADKQSSENDVASTTRKETDRTYDNDEQTIWFKSNKANGYAYLSNFFPHITPEAGQAFHDMYQPQQAANNDDYSFVIDDKHYATVEHFYQSQKYIDNNPEQAEAIRTVATALQAKEMSARFKSIYPISASFDAEAVMLRGLRAKFTQNKLLNRLLKETADKTLREIPGRTDSKWSNDQNMLGQLLMQLRDKLCIL